MTTPTQSIPHAQQNHLIAPKMAKNALAARARETPPLEYMAIDELIYAPTKTGGWILVKHPTRKMIVAGTIGGPATNGGAS